MSTMRKRDLQRAKRRILKPRRLIAYIEDCRAVDLTVGSNRHAHNVLPQLADLGCPVPSIAEVLDVEAETVVHWYNLNVQLPLRVYELLLSLLIFLADHSFKKDLARQEIQNCQCEVCRSARAGARQPSIRDTFLEYLRSDHG